MKSSWTLQDEIACLQPHAKTEREKAFRAGFLTATEKAIRQAIELTCQSLRKTAGTWDYPPELVIGFADLMEQQLPEILASICAEAVKPKKGEAK